MLPLEQTPVFGQRYELGGTTVIIAVVPLAPARQRDDRTVVEIVVPQRVETVASRFLRAGQPRRLSLILRGNEGNAAAPGSDAHPARNRRQYVVARVVEDAVRSVVP